jgi:hypothetical protein
MSQLNAQAVKVFISYCHADSRWLERLMVHLTPLSKDYEVDTWADTRLRPGSKWRDEIRAAVEKANVAVLIISADFLASEFVRTNELPPLLKAAEEEGALILPVIAAPSLFLRTPDLAQFQAVNNPSAPLVGVSEHDQEVAFVRVAEAILERAQVARRPPIRLEASASGRREAFHEPSTWNRLITIGDWIFDRDAGRIMGSGMHAYLLSREEYGDMPFVIQTTLEFSNFSRPGIDHAAGMNAGIVFGWKQDSAVPRYYNILLTGSTLLVERIGFHGEEDYRDFEHITDTVPLTITSGESVRFTVAVDNTRIHISVNDVLAQSLERPSGVVGRVGLRPWRSKMDCTSFVVIDRGHTAEQRHAAGGASRRG